MSCAGDSELFLMQSLTPETYRLREESNWENLGGKWVSSPHPREQGAAKLLPAWLGVVLKMYISPWFQLHP